MNMIKDVATIFFYKCILNISVNNFKFIYSLQRNR